MELYRVDYTLLGMVSPNCMKVLPISSNDEAEKKTQKVIFTNKYLNENEHFSFLIIMFLLKTELNSSSDLKTKNVK